MSHLTAINPSPASLSDQGEAVVTSLLQAKSVLELLSYRYEKSSDYLALMTISDMIDRALQQQNGLIGNLPPEHFTLGVAA